MTCTHALDNGPLICARTDVHDPLARGGHVYMTGSWVPDHHDATSGGEH